MTNWKQNICIACTLLCLGCIFLFSASQYPDDSNTFPVLLSTLLIILSLALAFQAIIGARKEGSVRFITPYPYRKVALQIILIATFAFIAPYIGYFIAGFLLCFATACNGGYPNRKISLLFSLGVSSFVFIVFKLVLNVSIPLGIFFAS